MKIRTAKKIMAYNPNCKINMHRLKHFERLRPLYVNEHGITVSPSWHDIDVVSRANARLQKWLRNSDNN